jgi:hypothetical protein
MGLTAGLDMIVTPLYQHRGARQNQSVVAWDNQTSAVTHFCTRSGSDEIGSRSV